jgi:hypothetical protein
LIDLFSSEKPETGVTLRDCEDAINISNPIAQHGGVQTFNIVQDQRVTNVFITDTRTARRVVENAASKKAELQAPDSPPEKRQRVSMTWSRLDKDQTKKSGRSPDRAVIEELNPKAHAVFFTDNMAFLKKEMMDDADNPYQQVYFVDVEVSRAAGGKITAYRVVGYHGKDDL